MPKSIAVKLTRVSKQYILHPEKPTLIESINPFRQPQDYWALKDINLLIHQGERLLIQGPNGSGKTTLLKVIAGITAPTKGIVSVHGSIVSLIELTAGFHPELDGISNIFLNGTLLGMTTVEIQHQLPAIIHFADIGNFINQPLYTYSNGMKLRLGFSVAIHTQPDILILDEAMAVGDKEFHQKSVNKISELIAAGATLIIVSHFDNDITNLCTRRICLERGALQSV